MTKYYAKPSKPVQWMNGFMSWLASRGIGPRKMVTLTVKGRRSGELRSVAVNEIEYEGQRYLVAPRGNTEWVRNVLAAGGEAVIRRGKEEPAKLQEIPAGERAPIIQKYLRENAWVTKREFGIDPNAPIEEFERIAPDHPVFRITRR